MLAAKLDWETIIGDIRSGPKVAIVLFAADDYDVDGRGEIASRQLQANNVDALILDSPTGFRGHGAGFSFRFARTYGHCLVRFLTEGVRASPCP